MILRKPFEISPSLLPALHVGDSWIESEAIDQFRILFANGEQYQIEDFKPGAMADLSNCFSAVLAFLSAWQEALQYSGKESDNYGLFDASNKTLVDWINQNSDEIAVLQYEIDESPKKLIG